MTHASVAELKARLSEFLAVVRGGDEVVITDRGRPVARLTALDPGDDARIAELARAGIVRPARRPLAPGGRRRAPVVEDPDGRVLAELLREREEGR